MESDDCLWPREIWSFVGTTQFKVQIKGWRERERDDFLMGDGLCAPPPLSLCVSLSLPISGSHSFRPIRPPP